MKLVIKQNVPYLLSSMLHCCFKHVVYKGGILHVKFLLEN